MFWRPDVTEHLTKDRWGTREQQTGGEQGVTTPFFKGHGDSRYFRVMNYDTQVGETPSRQEYMPPAYDRQRIAAKRQQIENVQITVLLTDRRGAIV